MLTSAKHGVGSLTALAFVLTVDDHSRFPKARVVGSYLGLRPRQNDSGDKQPQLRITKAGDVMLRRLLVECAQHMAGLPPAGVHIFRHAAAKLRGDAGESVEGMERARGYARPSDSHPRPNHRR